MFKVILEIGIEHIASVVSDDINATKKARRDLAAKCPTIMNLADPCHKFNLVISDVSADEMFNEVVSPMKSVLTHFKHSPQATGILNDIRKILQITTGLKSVGQTRFATLKISAESVIECMPALYKMNKDGYLTHAPEVSFFPPATNFFLRLKKLVKVVDPFARALMCLESTHSTIADNHIFWMAALSMVDELFRTPDGSFSEAEVQQLRGKINQRFDETINEPPNDVYILGSFGDPSESIVHACLNVLVDVFWLVYRDEKSRNLQELEPATTNYHASCALQCSSPT
ncbi:hypothetical protein BDV93DRAFT_571999 [Ceratobasidium sp. AG-I]|nr:hypothetical protein BDV93DRAFT_571999 [Ceratobasidium sp. AG-I]